jgi:hypothetical protein
MSGDRNDVASKPMCTVPGLEIDRWKYKYNINIIASSLKVAAPCGFSVCLYVSRVGTDKISES